MVSAGADGYLVQTTTDVAGTYQAADVANNAGTCGGGLSVPTPTSPVS